MTLSLTVSLLMFQYGILIKRVELNERSSCSDVSYSINSCWVPSQFNRIILIIVDALRYDFVNPTNSHTFYGGHMKNVNNLLSRNNGNSLLFHFIADPPTTTMQRLKALTTGSLPTFIDMNSNFASASISEDNWIDQLVQSGRKIVFMGDDTWVSLFPKQFHRKYHLPSFDVYDLHTVDDMILGNIYNELRRSDWTVLIAHFLGVDHCGHKHGPKSPEMVAKLSQMDDFIKNMTDLMNDETLLVVMGDHGMTETGDHGGDADMEIDAALFLYSRKKLLHSQFVSDSVSQVDIVPTLSLLLDLPIPFSNIGIVIESIFPQKLLPLVLRSNTWQIIRYAQRMASEIPELEWHLRQFESGTENLRKYRDTMSRMQLVFRYFWTSFNSYFIMIGLLSLLEAVLNCADSIFNGDDISISWLIFRSGLLFMQAATYITGDEEHYFSVIFILLCSSVSFRIIYLLNSLLTVTYSWSTVMLLFFLFFHAISFFSNSFIVFESITIRFLTQQKFNRPRRFMSFLDWFKHRLEYRKILMVLLVLFLLRLGSVFERCREEQQSACIQTVFAEPLSKVPSDTLKIIRFITAILSFSFANYFAYQYLQKFPSESVHSSFLFPSAIATICHWSTELIPDKVLNHFPAFSHITAQVVYVISLCGMLAICVRLIRKGPFRLFEGCSYSYMLCISEILALILGDGLALSLTIVLSVLFISLRFIDNEYHLVLFLTLFSSHSFFALAHQSTFTSIPWNAAFVGIPGNFIYHWIPATLIIMHVFASQILYSFSLPLFVFSIICATALHRRHLMMWKVFAPKFIFESLSLCIINITVVLTCCIFRNISFIK
ncbi:unnamed protein product [Dracunculus medinensis]|uniref:Uncharacterized protein n=1 Tax=Dracunculus medinensis TaxID=318479 RepID=A0A3P7P5I2_DRAME|nr:unnamed protein product [Dracunculus medinensis]